jgi:branched-chain amino acid transport system permease protein
VSLHRSVRPPAASKRIASIATFGREIDHACIATVRGLREAWVARVISFGLIVQAIFAGTTNGLTYALVGIGIAAIFKGTRVINVMQGEFSVTGAMVTVVALNQLQLPYWLAICGGVFSGALIGGLIEILFVRYMMRRGANQQSFILLTIGIAVTMSASVLFFVGRSGYLLPAFGGDSVFVVWDAVIRTHAIWLIAITLVIAAGLRAFYHHTTLGLSMMATSIDADGAATIGINVARMRTLTFVLGGILGAIAGILMTPLISVDYTFGINLTLKGFAAAILGGLTNPLGAVVGGVTLGLVESLSTVFISSSYKDVISFGVLIVIMIVMPNGMLGRAGRQGG